MIGARAELAVSAALLKVGVSAAFVSSRRENSQQAGIRWATDYVIGPP